MNKILNFSNSISNLNLIKFSKPKRLQSFLENRNISFISGSKSSSIPFILNIPKIIPELTNQPALIPTGELLKHGVYPPAGELQCGINKNGVNQNHLSGTNFEGWRVSYQYATMPPSYSFEWDENGILETIKSECDFIQKIKENDRYSKKNLYNVLLKSLRFVEKPEIRNGIKKLIVDLNQQKPESLYQDYIDLVESIKPFSFNEEEKDMIRNPFPIIWGSNSLTTIRVGDMIGEHNIKGKAILGKDLQVIFTNESNVKRLQKILNVYSVNVFSFQEAEEIIVHDPEICEYLDTPVQYV